MRNLVLKNQLVFGTVNAGVDAYAAASQDLKQFTSRWPEAVHGLITGRFSIEQHRELLDGRVRGIKDTIKLH